MTRGDNECGTAYTLSIDNAETQKLKHNRNEVAKAAE
jgi:hypothetical protein